MCICVYVVNVNTIMSCVIKPLCTVWSLSSHDVFLSRESFILNTTTSYVIKLSGKYFLFFVVLLFIGVIEH